MRKVYTDPALKDNKRWMIYTTHEMYKKYKISDAQTGYGVMQMANEALAVYIELFPIIDELQREANAAGMEIHEYITKVVKNRKDGSVK